VCVLARINFDGFPSATLYQRISRLHVVMKKNYNFPGKSELPKFILPMKITRLFSRGFRGGNEKFVGIRAGSRSRLVASPRVLVLQRESLAPNKSAEHCSFFENISEAVKVSRTVIDQSVIIVGDFNVIFDPHWERVKKP